MTKKIFKDTLVVKGGKQPAIFFVGGLAKRKSLQSAHEKSFMRTSLTFWGDTSNSLEKLDGHEHFYKTANGVKYINSDIYNKGNYEYAESLDWHKQLVGFGGYSCNRKEDKTYTNISVGNILRYTDEALKADVKIPQGAYICHAKDDQAAVMFAGDLVKGEKANFIELASTPVIDKAVNALNEKLGTNNKNVNGKYKISVYDKFSDRIGRSLGNLVGYGVAAKGKDGKIIIFINGLAGGKALMKPYANEKADNVEDAPEITQVVTDVEDDESDLPEDFI